MDAMATVMQTGGLTAEFPLFRTLGPLIPYPPLRKFFDFRSVLNTYNRRAVQRARQSSESKIVFANVLHDDENKKLGVTMQDKEIMSEATSLTIAGTDTTSVTLTYLIWAVVSRPKLREEVEREMAGLPEDFSDAELEALPLLGGVVMETLRLYGAGPGSLPRRVPKGGVTFEGYFIPEDVTVSSQGYTIHRDERLFANALE